ncbi:hypothetical protein HKD37_06G017305 [Glycine soja]
MTRLNLDHLPHYIDRHHFVQQQDNVQPLTGALESNNTTSKNHFYCRTIYPDQRRTNFVCKSHENGCTWSLGTSNSKRHKKWIIKSIRCHHTCLAPMLTQDHRQLDKHVIAQIKTLIAEIKTLMNYTPSYKKTLLEKQRGIIYQTIQTFGSFAILCSRDCVVAAQIKSVFKGREIVLGKKCLNVCFGHLIYAYCKSIIQVDGTYLHGKIHIHTENMHWRYLGNIRVNKPSVQLNDLPTKYWVQCFFNKGKCWGHMTTNLFESINSMSKNIRYLPGRPTNPDNDQLRLTVFGSRPLGNEERYNQAFIVTDTQVPLQTLRPGRGHDNSFGLPHECGGKNMNMKEIRGGPDPRRRRNAKGSLISTRILIEREEEENEQKNGTKCGIGQQQIHIRNNCPNILYASLRQMLLVRYFIYNVM